MPVTEDARLVLYGMTSPNVRKIVLMLEELEAPYALHKVKVFGGEQFTPAFRALNPLSKVPVLVDRDEGDYPVFESGAILIYLAEKFGRFLPAAGRGRYETLKWLFAQTSNVGPMLGQYNHFRVMGEAHAPAAYDRYRKMSARIYQLLDERLAALPYLAGDAYSIADIATYPWAGYVDVHEMDWADYPNLARWRAEIGARPAAQRELEIRNSLTFEPADSLQAASQADVDRFWWRD
jgi:GST-like protein